MIASSGPAAARSRIAEERVIKIKRLRTRPAAAQMGYQRLLRGLVQALLHHVDDNDRCAFRFQSDEQRNQGL